MSAQEFVAEISVGDCPGPLPLQLEKPAFAVKGVTNQAGNHRVIIQASVIPEIAFQS